MSRLAALRAAWAGRDPRERRVLAAGAAVLAEVLVWVVAIEPARTGLDRLGRALPQARAQAGELAGLLGEIRSLRKLPPAAPGTDARAALEKSLREAGFTAAKSTALDNGDLRYTFAGVSWARWEQWLVATEHDLGVRTVQLRAIAAPVPGNADVEATLRLPR